MLTADNVAFHWSWEVWKHLRKNEICCQMLCESLDVIPKYKLKFFFHYGFETEAIKTCFIIIFLSGDSCL